MRMENCSAVKIDTGTAGGLAVADRIYIFVCDYMGMRRNIPVVNSKNPVRKTDRLCCSGIYISFCCSCHLRDLRSNIILNVI